MLSLLAITLAGLDLSGVLSTLLQLTALATSGYLIPTLLPKMPALTQKAFEWLTQHAGHIKNQMLAGILTRLSTLIEQKVLAYENTEIEALKAAMTAGNITPVLLPRLLADMKARLIVEVKAEASAQTLWQDALYVFGGTESSLLSWVSSTVETHVAALPPSGLQTSK